LREAVEACRHGDNGLERSQDIEAKLKQRADQLAQEFVADFSAQRYQAAIDSCRKMQFVQRIQQQLAELQFELEET